MAPEMGDVWETMRVVHQYLELLRNCGEYPVHPQSVLALDADVVKRALFAARRMSRSEAGVQAAREVGGEGFASEVTSPAFDGRLMEACRSLAAFVPDDQAALVRNYWTLLLATEQSATTVPLATLTRAQKSDAIAIKARAADEGNALVDEFLRQPR